MTAWFLDACGLINLYASGHLANLARRQRQPFLLVPNVVREAGWVFKRQEQERAEKIPIDLGPLLSEGLIEITEPTAAVQTLFLRLATELDDGEAMTIAAASLRQGAGVVTDDEAAIKYLGRPGSPEVVSSLTLLREHLQGAALSDQQEALINIRVCARYLPGPRHPEIGWWRVILAHQDV